MTYSFTAYLETKKAKGSYLIAKGALSQYLRFVYPDDDQDEEILSLRYLGDSELHHFDYLRSFVAHLISSGKAPNTVHTTVSNVQYWLKWNDIIFTPSQASRFRSCLPRRVTIHDEADLTREKLVSLVSQSDVLMRAILLVLVSSGMRIGECLGMRCDQIRDNEVHLAYQQMKAKRPHVYFLSKEALQAIDEWMKIRDAKLDQSRVKTEKCLGVNTEAEDTRVFPYSYSVVAVKFVRIQQAAGCYELDENSKRGRLSFHSLRKYTDSTMNLYVSKNMTNALIGHFEKGDDAYRRYTREQLREAYAKVEPYLTILAPQEYAELRSETQQQLASHDKLLVALTEENYQMRQDNKMIKETLNSLVRYLESGK